MSKRPENPSGGTSRGATSTWTAKTWVLWPPRLRRRWSTASLRGSKPAGWGEQLHTTPPCTSGLKPLGMKSFLRRQKQKLQLLIRQNSGYSLNLWDNQQRGIIHQLQREQVNKVNIIVIKVWTHCMSSLSMSECGRGPESTGLHHGKSIQMELKVQKRPSARRQGSRRGFGTTLSILSIYPARLLRWTQTNLGLEPRSRIRNPDSRIKGFQPAGLTPSSRGTFWLMLIQEHQSEANWTSVPK